MREGNWQLRFVRDVLFSPGVLAILLVLALVVLAAYVTSLFPLVEWRLVDKLAVASLALVGSASWVTVLQKRGPLDAPLRTFLVGAFGLATITAALLLMVNALLDHGSSKSFVGVVVRTSQFHGRTTWTIVGAPFLPTTNDTLKLDHGVEAGGGDTVVVDVRPGFLGRPWVAGVKVRRLLVQ